MALIYITGPTGSGKSTVCDQLRKLGYECYDSDEPGMRHWRSKQTGEPVDSLGEAEGHSQSWNDENVFTLSHEKVEQLRADSRGRTIFLCGTSATDMDIAYDKIILLSIDEDVQRERIVNRTNASYGKNEKQLHAALRWRQPQLDKYRAHQAVEIDASRPLELVVSDILAAVV